MKSKFYCHKWSKKLIWFPFWNYLVIENCSFAYLKRGKSIRMCIYISFLWYFTFIILLCCCVSFYAVVTWNRHMADNNFEIGFDRNKYDSTGVIIVQHSRLKIFWSRITKEFPQSIKTILTKQISLITNMCV